MKSVKGRMLLGLDETLNTIKEMAYGLADYVGDFVNSAKFKNKAGTLIERIEENQAKVGEELLKRIEDNRETDLSKDENISALIEQIKKDREEIAFIEERIKKNIRQELREFKINLMHLDGLIVQVEISADSPACGKEIREIELPEKLLMVFHIRNGVVSIPDGRTSLLVHDKLTILGTEEDVSRAIKEFKFIE